MVRPTCHFRYWRLAEEVEAELQEPQEPLWMRSWTKRRDWLAEAQLAGWSFSLFLSLLPSALHELVSVAPPTFFSCQWMFR